MARTSLRTGRLGTIGLLIFATGTVASACTGSTGADGRVAPSRLASAPAPDGSLGASPGPTEVPPQSPPASPDAAASVATTTVEARDLSFRPHTLDISAAGRTEIVVHNAGRVVHNFTIDALGVQVVVSPGGTGEASIVAPAPGVYPFYCSVSGHKEAGMVGTLTVR